MENKKIAIVVDSGCNLPTEYHSRENVFIVPLRINYKDKEYIDGVTITADEIYARLKEEVPKTSLPSGQDILDTYDKIKASGFESVLVVSIASKLSGTHNLMELMAKSVEGLNFYVLDTKSIGIGAGLFAVDAIEEVDKGISFEDLIKRMESQVTRSKIYFSFATLEYLQKGGRIGLVSSILGAALKIKPVITCNSEGIYETAAKARGRKQSIEKMLEVAEKTMINCRNFYVAVCHGVKNEEYLLFREKLAETIFNRGKLIEVELAPALGIHTGPEMFGMSIYYLPE